MSTDKYCDEEGTLTQEQYKAITEKREWSLWFGIIGDNFIRSYTHYNKWYRRLWRWCIKLIRKPNDS